MKASFVSIYLFMMFTVTVNAHNLADSTYHYSDGWLKLPVGTEELGGSHGDIAISEAGEFYISTDEGVLVYDHRGQFLRNVPNAPFDFHGFVIHKDPDGQEYIYGTRLLGQTILKMALDGEVVLNVSADAIPDTFKQELGFFKRIILKAIIKLKYDQSIDLDKPTAFLTSVDVGPDGDIYVVDGYGLDYIHRFDSSGQYIASFAGRNAPWSFENCHKIAIDPRFSPQRLNCTDRANDRIVQMDLDGNVIGVIAENLLKPSAMAFHDKVMAVAEIAGRVSLLDMDGNTITTLGQNTVEEEVNTEDTPPEKWRPGVFTSPHGIVFDAAGNVHVNEWNKWGRVLRFDVKKKNN